jgi:hypothetical protein
MKKIFNVKFILIISLERFQSSSNNIDWQKQFLIVYIAKFLDFLKYNHIIIKWQFIYLNFKYFRFFYNILYNIIGEI